ncbi:hypothetical protein [Deinococcus roseus]|uniref:Uncharacterized protein n=1 Tax=Deinococcus roseus TaxID=392414 RepID=A0ABQ2D7Q7_9DEIO|nr:hypothetical protein [Deinococcus roseus]GGJ47626.1 hypothetical protein GCM10008938_37010 [Deinococcus roseus]
MSQDEINPPPFTISTEKGEVPLKQRYWTFMVDEQPRVMWTAMTHEEHIRFLNGIDSSYWAYMAYTHQEEAAGDDDNARFHAMMAMKVAFSQAMETLFSLVGALVQAPFAPLGWSLAYNNGQLKNVVQKITSGDPIPNFWGLPTVTWEKVAEIIFKLFNIEVTETKPTESEALRQLPVALRLLAELHLSDNNKHEYNSIKHGSRVGMGGEATMTIGIPGTDQKHTLEAKNVALFYVVEPLGRQDANFIISMHINNWDPASISNRLLVISPLINLLRLALLAHLGEPLEEMPEFISEIGVQMLSQQSQGLGDLLNISIGTLDAQDLKESLKADPVDLDQHLQQIYGSTLKRNVAAPQQNLQAQQANRPHGKKRRSAKRRANRSK